MPLYHNIGSSQLLIAVTEQSLALAQELTTTAPTGKNWRVLGMKLLDLSQIDQDLGAWVVL